MDALEFCRSLVDRITPEEWRLLECADVRLYVNEHNRAALLEMRVLVNEFTADTSEKCDSVDPERASVPANESQAYVDPERAGELAKEIQAYLDTYMSEAPEGHKWIVLACLYLTFVAKRPMHPIERVGAQVSQVGGRMVFRCPNKAPGDNPICDNCVCEPL